MRLRDPLLEALAAATGLVIVVGESLEKPVFAETNCNDGQCDWPTQRRGSGVHFRARIQKAKYLGRLPGLNKLAAKLREPRTPSVLMAEFAPPPSPTQTPPPEGEALQAKSGDDDGPHEPGRVAGTRG